jgi:hypothetical protein
VVDFVEPQPGIGRLMMSPLLLGFLLLGVQPADDLPRRLGVIEAQHTEARIAVLEATVADLKKTTREDTLWIRGIIAAGVGLGGGVGIAKLRQQKRNGTTHA